MRPLIGELCCVFDPLRHVEDIESGKFPPVDRIDQKQQLVEVSHGKERTPWISPFVESV